MPDYSSEQLLLAENERLWAEVERLRTVADGSAHAIESVLSDERVDLRPPDSIILRTVVRRLREVVPGLDISEPMGGPLRAGETCGACGRSWEDGHLGSCPTIQPTAPEDDDDRSGVVADRAGDDGSGDVHPGGPTEVAPIGGTGPVPNELRAELGWPNMPPHHVAAGERIEDYLRRTAADSLAFDPNCPGCGGEGYPQHLPRRYGVQPCGCGRPADTTPEDSDE
jgi:hypothetical protein